MVFEICMASDVRELDGIRRVIRKHLASEQAQQDCPEHMRDWQPSDYDLQIMIGRPASRPLRPGTDEWDFYPAYTRPVRFVSRQRVLALAYKIRTDEETKLLLDMLADLANGVKHFRAAHTTARQREADLTALVEDALNHILPGGVHG